MSQFSSKELGLGPLQSDQEVQSPLDEECVGCIYQPVCTQKCSDISSDDSGDGHLIRTVHPSIRMRKPQVVT